MGEPFGNQLGLSWGGGGLQTEVSMGAKFFPFPPSQPLFLAHARSATNRIDSHRAWAKDNQPSTASQLRQKRSGLGWRPAWSYAVRGKGFQARVGRPLGALAGGEGRVLRTYNEVMR